jgi:hypothetical protein
MLSAFSKMNEVSKNIIKRIKDEKEDIELDIINKKEVDKDLCLKKIIQNKIKLDLLNNLRFDYLNRITYYDYINNNNQPIQIKNNIEDIYMNIYKIEKEQKQLEKDIEI